jgi:hypothetical protein
MRKPPGLLAPGAFIPSLLHRRLRFRGASFLFALDSFPFADVLPPETSDYRPWLE